MQYIYAMYIIIYIYIYIFQGDIVKCFICNYKINFEWLLGEIPSLMNIPRVDFVHGERDKSRRHELATQIGTFANMNCHYPRMPIPWGTHHSKMMLLYYGHGLRVVVCTLNLLPVDWRNKTQGIWLQVFLY